MLVQNNIHFSAQQAVAVTCMLLLLLAAGPVSALGNAGKVADMRSLWSGRKMLHCCGWSKHQPWSFSWLVRLPPFLRMYHCRLL